MFAESDRLTAAAAVAACRITTAASFTSGAVSYAVRLLRSFTMESLQKEISFSEYPNEIENKV